MNKELHRCNIFLLLFIVFEFSSVHFCFSQSVSEETGSVKFISVWPSNNHQKSNVSISKKVKDVVLGKNSFKLIKPVSLLHENNSYWVLDQESKKIVESNDDDYKTPKFIEKEKLDLASLVSITNFKSKKMLVVDSYLNEIFVIDRANKKFSKLNDSLALDRPTGIAYSTITNKIWVVETGKHRLLMLNQFGKVEKVVGGRGKGNGQFNFPTSIAADLLGNIYVVDAMNFRVQVFSKEGDWKNSFGSNGDVTGSFASPKGIALDSYGHIFIVDALFNAVQVFDKQGNFLYTFGQQGRDNGQFWMPSGIFIDNENRIYVADSYNSRIQEFQLMMGEK